MKFRFLSVVAGVLLPIVANAAMPHVGFYQTIDDETKTPSVLNVRGKIGPFGRTQKSGHIQLDTKNYKIVA